MCFKIPTDTVTTMATGFLNPSGLAFSPSGSLVYVATDKELWQMSVFGGNITTLAGSGVGGFADGQDIAAMFVYAKSLAVHSVTGVLYIPDNNRIRTCSPHGLVSTLAGTGAGGNVDGPALIATFNLLYGIVMNPASEYLYVTCNHGNTVRQVAVSNGFTTTLAGSGASTSIDGQGRGASLYGPSYEISAVHIICLSYYRGIAWSISGDLIVTDASSNLIRLVTLPGAVVCNLKQFWF